jgi:hypothetical protein
MRRSLCHAAPPFDRQAILNDSAKTRRRLRRSRRNGKLISRKRVFALAHQRPPLRG